MTASILKHVVLPYNTTMNISLKTAAFTFLTAATALAADPYIAYVYPVAIQAGTTNRLIVGGQNFWGGQTYATVSGEGVTVLSVTRVPSMPPTGSGGQFKYLKGWLDSIANGVRTKPPLPNDPHISEWRECTWWRQLDELDAIELALVEHNLHTPRNSLQMSPSLRDKLIITVAVSPNAKPCRRDIVLFTPGASSAPHALFTTSAPHVHEPLYVPPHRRKPGKTPPKSVSSPLPVFIDGQIMPGETDRFSFSFAKGQRIKFTLTAREVLPYIGDAVPGFFNAVLRLLDPNGKEIAFADDNSFHPDPVMTVEIPSSGNYVLEVRDNLYRGREDFVYTVAVEKAKPTPVDAPKPRKIQTSFDGKDTWVFDGVAGTAGKSAKHEIEIKEPGLRVIEVEARSAGSPLDPVVALYDMKDGMSPSGRHQPLATWDDTTNTFFVGSIAQSECDPKAYHNFLEPGCYTITVADRTGGGGKDYFYRLTVRPPAPDFTVYATRSTFPVRFDNRTVAKFKIVRHDGFDGEVKLLDTPELNFKKGVFPADSNEFAVVAAGTLKSPGRSEMELYAEGLVNGKPVKRKVIPTDEEEQAFAWTHLIPSRTFYCTYAVRKPQPARPAKWLDLPERRFADMSGTTNILFEVMATNTLAELRTSVSRRRLRGRSLVRARSATTPTRHTINSLFLAGVNEIDDLSGNPINDPYAKRLMGMTQNASPDADVLVYSPTSSLAAANAIVKRLRNEGWCADLLFEDRIDALNSSLSYRVIYVPDSIPRDPERMAQLVNKVDGLVWSLVFANRLPDGIEGDFVAKGKCHVCQRKNKRPRITYGYYAEALGLAWARREPFRIADGLRFTRWKDGEETVYFIMNVGKEKVSKRFKTSAKAVSVKMFEPGNGKISSLPAQKGEFDLSLPPGGTRFLRIYPY